jgi:chromosome segregation ATPase
MRERVRREELTARYSQVEMECAQAKSERENLREERDREQESAANLHAVLEEFQAGTSSLSSFPLSLRLTFSSISAKDRELQALLGDLQTQLHDTTRELEAYKQRATQAEDRLSAAQNDSQRVLELSKEVKEKNLLTGKLRHEGTSPHFPFFGRALIVRLAAVILNEHLTEALRRLKKNSSENSVDQCVSSPLSLFPFL